MSARKSHKKNDSVSSNLVESMRATKHVAAERRIQTGSMLASSGRFNESKGPMAATLDLSKSEIELERSFLTT